MEAVDLVLMVFTAALLRILSFWNVKPKVGYGKDRVDLSITGRRSVKELIYNSN